jgi:hypothetical protein
MYGLRIGNPAICGSSALTIERSEPMNLPPQLQELRAVQKSGTGLVVLLSTRGQISIETHTALSANCDGLPKAMMTVARRPIVDARNGLVAMAVNAAPRLPWTETYVLWCDDDSWWLPGTITKMIDTMKSYPMIDVLCGAFSARVPFGSIRANRIAGIVSPPIPGVDCQLGEVVEVAECGMHFVIHRLSLLERVGANPFDRFGEVGEDFSFCRRVKAAGLRIFCATAAVIAHLDPRDGLAYVPGDAAMKIENNALVRITGEHLAPKTVEERTYDTVKT